MNLKVRKGTERGFTLIEILIVIGIIAILAGIVLVALNPARQFAQARDSQRISNLNAILNAIGQRIADNKGTFAGDFTVAGEDYTCGVLPQGVAIDDAETITTDMAIDDTSETSDLGCLVPTYIPNLPKDPTWVEADAEEIIYKVYQDEFGRVHVIAEEEEPSLTREDPIEVTR